MSVNPKCQSGIMFAIPGHARSDLLLCPIPLRLLRRSNIVFYIALGALGAFGLLALLATGRVSPQNVLGLLIALSNAFGLIAGAPSLLCWTVCIPAHGIPSIQ